MAVVFFWLGANMLNLDSKKVVIKIFDRKNSTEKRPHTCSTCGIYKREIEKGNREALEFYEAHIRDVAHRNNGVTFVLYSRIKRKILAGSSVNSSKAEP
jgi:hypothetical protein